jgi:hypothetical protein
MVPISWPDSDVPPTFVPKMVPLPFPESLSFKPILPTCISSDESSCPDVISSLVVSPSSSTLADDLDSTRANPPSVLGRFFAALPHSTARRTISAEFAALRDSLPPSPTNPYTPLQMAAVWLSEQCANDTFGEAFLYKKVANKTRPVATTLPEKFRIIRREHPDPLAGMLPLPTRPPEFAPAGRITRERLEQMTIGKDFLWPEEIKLAEWIVCQHEKAFAWSDSERGCFDPEYFAPVEIPIISHIPWALKQGPIPRGILPEVIRIIKDKCQSGVYEPSSSSYNTRWFCVVKKDGKSLRLVHSLEPLNAVSIKNSAMPPYTDAVAEDFAGRSIYTTLDLYVAFDQRQLHPDSRDMTTFDTPLGPQRLTVLPMGWTLSPSVLQGDVTHILKPEIPQIALPFADDTEIKGPKTRYELSDGSYETIPENPGIRRFVWEHLVDVHRIIQRVEAYGATFSGKKSFIGVPRADVLGHICTYEGRVADPSRIKVIQDWPIPTNVSEVRAFLGTCGVLRIFIKGYTLVARPLIQLTRKDEPFEIGPSQLEAFEKLKDAVANSPALRPIEYDTDRPVILAVDSCANGAGYILLQLGEDKKRYPSRFGSITFNDRESRYSQAKLELYGLFRALKQTQLFTIGVRKLIVEMDAKFVKGMINNPTMHPNDAINRWISAILLFDFTLVHVPAAKHTGADGLSRRPRTDDDLPGEEPDELEEWIDVNSGFFIEVNTPTSRPFPMTSLALVCGSSDGHLARFYPPASEHASPLSSSSSFSSPDAQTDVLLEIPRSAKALKRDEKLSLIRHFLETLERPPDLTDEEYRLFIRQAMDYFIYEKRMFRKTKDGGAQQVPDIADRYSIIQYAHDVLGHKGIFATTRNILLRFWWPLLNDDVRWYTRTCHECQVRQTEYFHIPPSVPHVPSLFRKAHCDTFLMPRVGSY